MRLKYTSIKILKAVASTSKAEVEALVTQWCNCTEVDIDENGDVFVANPQAGHWLDADAKAELVAFIEAQK